MINITDLRVGNLVKFNGNIEEVSSIKYNGFVNFKLNIDIEVKGHSYTESPSISITKVEPIDLGSDYHILEKLGFVDGVIENDNFKFVIMYYDCWNISYEEFEGYGQSECFIRTFLDVHELQNLYKTLTGIELIYNQNEKNNK